jgi:YHS domain-containing protein
MRALGLFVLAIVATVSVVSAQEMNMSSIPSVQQSVIPDAPLKTSLVCMMNNKYFGTEQIPVEVDGKTYYGCCEGCKTTLKMDPQARMSLDPLSGKEVDKATAFIAPVSKNNPNVFYFESKENYEKYRQTQ